MRLDKFLKISRIIKRRTIAKEVCDHERITINGRIAKAGTEVKVGDILIINFGTKIIEVKVLDVPEVIKSNEAKSIYEIVREERKESL